MGKVLVLDKAGRYLAVDKTTWDFVDSLQKSDVKDSAQQFLAQIPGVETKDAKPVFIRCAALSGQQEYTACKDVVLQGQGAPEPEPTVAYLLRQSPSPGGEGFCFEVDVVGHGHMTCNIPAILAHSIGIQRHGDVSVLLDEVVAQIKNKFGIEKVILRERK